MKILDAGWGWNNGVARSKLIILDQGRRKTIWQPLPFSSYCYAYKSDVPKIQALARKILDDDGISWDHRPIVRLEFPTPEDVSVFRDYMYKKHNVKLLEADVTYGTNMILDLGLEQDPSQEHFLCYIDIETDPRKRSSISEMDKAEARVVSVSIRDKDGKETWICEDDEFLLFEKTKRCLEQFIAAASWSNFDMDYLLSRAKKLGVRPGSLLLPAMDLMNLYSNIVKRSTGGRMFVSLKQACDECKIEMKDLGVKEDITLVWKYFSEHQWDKLHEYNAEDTRAVFEIDKKLQLTASRFKLSEMFNMPLKATQYNSHIIDMVALRLARQSKPRIVFPCKPVTFYCGECRDDEHGKCVAPCECANKGHKQGGKFVGAVVIEPKPGIVEWVGVFDFAALYPNIIKSLNIGCETLSHSRDAEHVDDMTYQTPKYAFEKHPDSIPRKIVKLADEWKAEANRIYDAAMPGTVEKFKAFAVKRASKVLLVSLYGVLGSPVCRMYNVEVAESITATGRAVILDTKHYAETLGWEVLYGDTDSIFIKFKSTGLEECLKEAEQLTSVLNEHIQTYVKGNMGAEDVTLEMELDQVYSRLLIGRGAKKAIVKKRYAGRCKWEKQPCDYTYIVGFEIVRRDWTELAKDVQRYVLNEVLEKGGTQEEVRQRITPWVDQLKSDLYAGTLDKKLWFWRALPRPIEEYQGVKKGKGIPPQVRVAIQLRSMGKFEQRTPFAYVCSDKDSLFVPIIDNVTPRITVAGYDYYWRGQVLAILHRLGFDFGPVKKTAKTKKLESFGVRRLGIKEVLDFLLREHS